MSSELKLLEKVQNKKAQKTLQRISMKLYVPFFKTTIKVMDKRVIAI